MTGLQELDGKVAVITGGASGIGLGIARQLQAAGMKIGIADVDPTSLDRVAAEHQMHGVLCDVSSAESVAALAEAAAEKFGAVHVLVNNAGVGPAGDIADLQLSDWEWMLGVNLWGAIHATHSFLPLLKANADGGCIGNTASVGGLITMPGMAAYSVTKAG